METKPEKQADQLRISGADLREIASTIPAQPGTYLLFLSFPHQITIQVGKLGRFFFDRGKYGYFGSALGAGGLRSRINRHLTPSLKPHWHLDWLKPYFQPYEIIYLVGKQHLECEWLSTIHHYPNITIPAPGFGSSDCRKNCPAHLIYLGTVQVQDIHSLLRAQWQEVQRYSINHLS